MALDPVHMHIAYVVLLQHVYKMIHDSQLHTNWNAFHQWMLCFRYVAAFDRRQWTANNTLFFLYFINWLFAYSR